MHLWAVYVTSCVDIVSLSSIIQEVHKAQVGAKKDLDSPDKIPDGQEEPQGSTQQQEVRKVVRDRSGTKKNKAQDVQKVQRLYINIRPGAKYIEMYLSKVQAQQTNTWVKVQVHVNMNRLSIQVLIIAIFGKEWTKMAS